jgi:hypothetical protein
LQLNPKAHLTLIIDGVLEATTPTGKILGFERTASNGADSRLQKVSAESA